MAHLRHRQGRRLPRRPGRRRDHVPRRPSTPSSTSRRWACRSTAPPRARIDQRRFGGHTRDHGEAAGAPRLLRRRPHRPHDPADAVPELRQARHRVLQRVLRPRPAADRGRRRAAQPPASSPTSWPPARSTSSRPSRSSSPPAASARSSRPPPTRTPSPATASASSGARACRWRTWSSTSSTRPAWPGWASCSPRRARGEGGILRNGRRRALHGALRPHHQGPRAARHRRPVRWSSEVREGRGAGPNKDYVYLDLHPPARRAASRPSCPTSPSSPAPTSASTRSPSRCRSSRPRTTRWAASRPTSRPRCCATTPPSSRACTPPASAPASRCTAPTGSAPTRCWTSTCSAAAPASPPPSTPRQPSYVDAARGPGARGASDLVERLRDSDRHRAGRGHPHGAAGDDGQQRAGVPHRGDAQAGAGRRPGAQGAVHAHRDPGQGQALQHRPARGRRARLPARPGRGHGRRRPATARSPAAATSARTTRPATTSTSCGTRWPTARTGSDGRPTIRLDYKPVTVTRYQPMERKY